MRTHTHRLIRRRDDELDAVAEDAACSVRLHAIAQVTTGVGEGSTTRQRARTCVDTRLEEINKTWCLASQDAHENAGNVPRRLPHSNSFVRETRP
jgi:hypothetical protein